MADRLRGKGRGLPRYTEVEELTTYPSQISCSELREWVNHQIETSDGPIRHLKPSCLPSRLQQSHATESFEEEVVNLNRDCDEEDMHLALEDAEKRAEVALNEERKWKEQLETARGELLALCSDSLESSSVMGIKLHTEAEFIPIHTEPQHAKQCSTGRKSLASTRVYLRTDVNTVWAQVHELNHFLKSCQKARNGQPRPVSPVGL